MRTVTPAQAPGSAIPREPTEVGIAGVRWRRTGLLQRLTKLDRDAQTLAADDRSPAEQTATRRAA